MKSALIRACRANLDDDLARLVLSDWLSENGEFEKGENIRRWINIVKPKVIESWENGVIDTSLDNENLKLIAIQLFKLACRDSDLIRKYEWFNSKLFKLELNAYELSKMKRFHVSFKIASLGNIFMTIFNGMDWSYPDVESQLWSASALIRDLLRWNNRVNPTVKVKLAKLNDYLVEKINDNVVKQRLRSSNL